MPRMHSTWNKADNTSGATAVDEDATPDIENTDVLTTANTMATIITGMDGGTAGESILLVIGDALTTIDFSASTMKGNNGIDKLMRNGEALFCTFDGTNWFCTFVFLEAKPSESVVATNVITALESGTTFYLNAAGGFISTLPAPALGLNYTFIVGTALSGGTCTVVTDSSANIMNVMLLDVVGELVYATAQDVVTFTDGAVVGGRLEVESDGTSWFCKAYGGVDADITTGQT